MWRVRFKDLGCRVRCAAQKHSSAKPTCKACHALVCMVNTNAADLLQGKTARLTTPSHSFNTALRPPTPVSSISTDINIIKGFCRIKYYCNVCDQTESTHCGPQGVRWIPTFKCRERCRDPGEGRRLESCPDRSSMSQLWGPAQPAGARRI